MKTAKQILKEAPRQRVSSAKDWEYSESTILKAMGDYAYQYQEQKEKWVSVKERLPDFNVTVLAIDNFKKISFTCVDSRGILDEFNLEAYHPKKAYWTHWMPLPSNPK